MFGCQYWPVVSELQCGGDANCKLQHYSGLGIEKEIKDAEEEEDGPVVVCSCSALAVSSVY